jgi:hypothetical protein
VLKGILILTKQTKYHPMKVFKKLHKINIVKVFGKGSGSVQVLNNADGRAPMWKLPYWEILEVPNAIDVMHVMKNFCMNLLLAT